MGKVIPLFERTERWDTSYVSPDGSLTVRASSHGRLSFQATVSDRPVVLDFVDSVSLIMKLKELMEFT